MAQHYRTFPPLTERDTPRKHTLTNPKLQGRLDPVALVEQLTTTASTALHEEHPHSLEPPGRLAADTTRQYAAEAVADLQIQTVLTRFEQMWLAGWLDHAYTPTVGHPQQADETLDTWSDVTGHVLQEILLDIIANRLDDSISYTPTNGLGVQTDTDTNAPSCTEQVLYDAAFTSWETDELITSISQEATAVLPDTARIAPETVADAVAAGRDRVDATVPDTPTKTAAFLDCVTAEYGIDGSHCTFEPLLDGAATDDIAWPSLVTGLSDDAVTAAVRRELIESGHLDGARHRRDQ